jgi:hypothetical protein
LPSVRDPRHPVRILLDDVVVNVDDIVDGRIPEPVGGDSRFGLFDAVEESVSWVLGVVCRRPYLAPPDSSTHDRRYDDGGDPTPEQRTF